MGVEQVNATNNQSTLKIEHKHVFLGNNKFDEIILSNDLETAEITLKSGLILIKTAAGEVDVLDVAANIVNVVGILKMDNEVALADAATRDVNYAIQGDIAEEHIDVSNVALNVVIPTTQRTLRDHLNGLGFHLAAGIENTKFDNI